MSGASGKAGPPLEDGISWFMRLTDLTGRTIFRCVTRVHIEGVDRSVLPATGPLIIAANHLSNADAPLIGSWLTPILGRRIHWLGKQEALDWPVLGWALSQNAVFGIRRGAADVEAFRLARRVLDEGHVLVVFPEGTRSPTGGLQEAKDGLAILSLRTGAPILPIGIAGTDRFWPRGQRLWGIGGSVTMCVGRPFTPARPGPGEDRRAAQREATRLIMTRIAELLPPRHRGVYAAEVAPAGLAADGSSEGSMR